MTDTLLNPSAALQSTAEDFLHSLSQSPGAAQAELINCILRACGCNDVLDADQVVDYDGVLDALDNFTEGLKQVISLLPTPRPANTPPGKLTHISPHLQTPRIQTLSRLPLGTHRTSCSSRCRTRITLLHRSHNNPSDLGHCHVFLSDTLLPPHRNRRRPRSRDRPVPGRSCR